MLNDAVKTLLVAYNKGVDIAEVKEKRKIVDEKLKYFTKEELEKKLAELEKLKPGDTASGAEMLKYNKFLSEFEIFKIQYETYRAMNDDIGQYDKLKKDMEKKIKKTKAFLKDVIKMQNAYKNLKIQW